MLGNSNENNKKYTTLKLVSTVGPLPDRKTDAPKFYVVDENFNLTDKSYTSVKGKLSWIKSTFTPKKGRMGDIYGFKAFIEDGDNVAVIESTITNASKSWLNNLLTCKGENIELSVYTNKTLYPDGSVKKEDGTYAKGLLDFKSLSGPALKDAIDATFVKKEEAPTGEISIEDIPF